MITSKLLRNKQTLIPLFFVLFLLVGWFLLQNINKTEDIKNFEECAENENPISESYPRQCRTPSGLVFTEDIGNELDKQNLIRVIYPRPNSVITSPIDVKGEARGNWYFEANFPIRLEDNAGNVLGRGIATAEGDWMTESFVPFTADLSFSDFKTSKGILILERNNPSGLPQNSDQLRIPVRFKENQKTTLLYYYNEKRDPNYTCSQEAVLPVKRSVINSITPIQDSLKLLLEGNITEEEKAQGFTTEYPLSGVELKGVNLKNGLLTIELVDPHGKTTGGSCRATLLRTQIEKTVKQFQEVKEVRFIPDYILQP